MIRSLNGILPDEELCKNNNKSAFKKGLQDICIYLHNIAVYENEESEISIFNREIDEKTLDVIRNVICLGNSGKSPYLRCKLYCCRDISKRIDTQKLSRDPSLKGIAIFSHPSKDIFHDRFLVFENKTYEQDYYIMGNSISSFIEKPMSISQMAGQCIKLMDGESQLNLRKELTGIINGSRQIYPEVQI